MTKVVVVKDWPGQNSPPSCSIFGMIETAQEWQRANDIGPVIVMDMYVQQMKHNFFMWL